MVLQEVHRRIRLAGSSTQMVRSQASSREQVVISNTFTGGYISLNRNKTDYVECQVAVSKDVDDNIDNNNMNKYTVIFKEPQIGGGV